MKTVAIITAGGTSSRFGNSNKLLEKIYDKEVIQYTIDAFEKSNIDEIIISSHVSIMEHLKELFKDYKKVRLTKGGNTRQESVYNGIIAAGKCDYVLIHDGARPMVTTDMVNNCIEMVKDMDALTVATKTVDTIKEVEHGKIIRTIDRAKLYNTQTPQAFKYGIIKDAHERLKDKNFTDDAGMLEALGKKVCILDGSYKNIKITTQTDLEIAKIFLKQG